MKSFAGAFSSVFPYATPSFLTYRTELTVGGDRNYRLKR